MIFGMKAKLPDISAIKSQMDSYQLRSGYFTSFALFNLCSQFIKPDKTDIIFHLESYPLALIDLASPYAFDLLLELFGAI